MARRRLAVLAIALASSTTLPTEAANAASDQLPAVGAEGPGGCADWGAPAVRNWLTGRCPAPTGVVTYTRYLRGGEGIWIRGLQDGDNCSYSPDKPLGKYDFAPACDMHDYGFWLMQHGQLKKTQANLTAINSWFYTVLRHGVCGSYRGDERSECRRIAYSYAYTVQPFAGSPIAPV